MTAGAEGCALAAEDTAVTGANIFGGNSAYGLEPGSRADGIPEGIWSRKDPNVRDVPGYSGILRVAPIGDECWCGFDMLRGGSASAQVSCSPTDSESGLCGVAAGEEEPSSSLIKPIEYRRFNGLVRTAGTIASRGTGFKVGDRAAKTSSLNLIYSATLFIEADRPLAVPAAGVGGSIG